MVAVDTAARGRAPMSERRRTLLRLEISRAAVRLFRTHGVAATSGERIGAAVGLSARTVWRYFGTKESCVEPVLVRSIEPAVSTLRCWPPDRTLAEHLLAEYRPPAGPEEAADADAGLAVIALARTEPGLRAVWLAVHERAEQVLAEALAGRLGRAADDVEVRVHAAAIAAALRISGEDVAAEVAAGAAPADPVSRLCTALRAATDGVGAAVGAPVATATTSVDIRPGEPE
ncbi:transcriptional regulator, TetR family [Pseudonocardia ammonioxydans]|uniref:Transcriptional regulator, TetR family n=1 Tax=Pseudonocardia ammonioxydans TaxID=260086 RepID=A0A1I4Y743_PSUAM|nr:TetR/AcrR family transcriptional regulator [Pseudonocardia ammonioxydans]SFN33861.1 transcriptional regulator, TetR family [Pseudonocardia ammonioxydans]